MTEQKKGSSGSALVGGIIFLAGFAVALLVGWVVFPGVIYSQKTQPINFSHVAHQDSSCESCHDNKPDGTYSGIPKLDKCRECHETAMGSTEAERILVEEYIQKEKEVPWLIYSWQPDNVFFSHAPHKGQGMECVTCHRDVSKEEKLPVHQENRLTGYSKTTIKMTECEKCHAERGTTNSCLVCHK